MRAKRSKNKEQARNACLPPLAEIFVPIYFCCQLRLHKNAAAARTTTGESASAAEIPIRRIPMVVCKAEALLFPSHGEACPVLGKHRRVPLYTNYQAR